MLKYILKRFLVMIPMMICISALVFFIIQLPPGDYMTTYISHMEKSGEQFSMATIQQMRQQYGLDDPWYIQYFKWMSNILFRGDFGYSFLYERPVAGLLTERMGLTLLISGSTMIFTYAVSIPIGIYSAVRQYSIGDHIVTTIGFLGMAIPNFLLAILLMYTSLKWFGNPLLGLIPSDVVGARWTFGTVLEILSHLAIPVVVIGVANTCGLIRVMRGQMLDEISQQYVITARAKGLSERKILWKYCVRGALNPIVSSIGWSLTGIFTGSTISAIVMNLPTEGPMLQKALINQDMYLAGAWLLFMAALTLIGTLISDILLGWLDPRVRISEKGELQ